MAVKNHNFRFNEEKEAERKAWKILHSEEVKEDAFVKGIVEAVEQKVLDNLPGLAGMYMMQQQSLLSMMRLRVIKDILKMNFLEWEKVKSVWLTVRQIIYLLKN